MTNKNAPLVQISDLYKKFGKHVAVNGLSLHLAPGEILALLGPNGAGKTTTINCVLGFLKPDRGTLRVMGIDPVQRLAEARAQLAYIPEQVALYSKLTGMENLQYMAKVSGSRQSLDELRALFKAVNLAAESIDQPVSTYSKGMRQKVGIAIALAKKARVLILDEPSSGLDPAASYDFSQIIQALAAKGTGILLATHDLYRAQEDASRVIIINRGQLVSELSGNEIKNAGLETLYLEKIRGLETEAAKMKRAALC